MVQRVFERVKLAKGLDRIIVATDDERTASVVRGFGGEVMMTDPELPSGTDRVAAVAEKIEADVYVNVQGDEPLMAPAAIEAAVELVRSGSFAMGTVMRPFKSVADLENRSLVKVLSDRNGRAIYFSRLPIPYGKKTGPDPGEATACRNHVGLYTYTRDTLFRIRSLPPSPYEVSEMLEQLRALQDGIQIGIAEVDFQSFEVNVPEDLDKIRLYFVEHSLHLQ
jgi:3-deoxy-manno-octulosonate cytidylyltransferase (CMP-KDO synthetase)